MPLIGGKNAKKKTSSSTKRNFTVVIGNKEHGLYVSSSPSSAARKAVSKLCATDKKKKVQFSIREITQGSKKKTYGPYVGKMKKLDKPIELKGRIIKYSTDVYLDKKNSSVKMGKKVGNKMRGGSVKITGRSDSSDFVNDDYNLYKVVINKFSREPYLFFGKNKHTWTDKNGRERTVNYHENLAYNSGFFPKKAMFESINALGVISRDILISDISIQNLIILQTCIKTYRSPEYIKYGGNAEFCSTILTAIEEELEKPDRKQEIENLNQEQNKEDKRRLDHQQIYEHIITVKQFKFGQRNKRDPIIDKIYEMFDRLCIENPEYTVEEFIEHLTREKGRTRDSMFNNFLLSQGIDPWII
jgi:hypothetical protein